MGAARVHDVVVAGGGPAGATAASRLRQLGRDVVLLERTPHPRFQIGESLLPFTLPLLDRIGFLPTLASAGFVEKHGSEFLRADRSLAYTFYFADGLLPGGAYAYQVTRSRFDHLLLDHCRGLGADVREGHEVRDVRFDADGVRVSVRDADGRPYELRARYLADATGRAGLPAAGRGRRVMYPKLRKAAVFAHFHGARRDAGRDAGNTISLVFDGGWIWIIPLEHDVTSVGVVVDGGRLRAEGAAPQAFLERVIHDVDELRMRLAGATRCTPVRVASDFAYTTRALWGRRHVVLGDAGFFLDPVFASGVHLAVSAGVYGAEALHERLTGRSAPNPLRRYARRMRRAERLYRRFVHGWYAPRFLDLFLQPAQSRFQLLPAVTSVLAGAEVTGRLRLRVRLFFLLAWVNRYLPLVPRGRPVPVASGAAAAAAPVTRSGAR